MLHGADLCTPARRAMRSNAGLRTLRRALSEMDTMRQLLILLGLLTAFAPLTTDMYLPAFSAIASDLHAPMSLVQATVAVFLTGTAFGQLI